MPRPIEIMMTTTNRATYERLHRDEFAYCSMDRPHRHENFSRWQIRMRHGDAYKNARRAYGAQRKRDPEQCE